MNILQVTLGFLPAASWGGPVNIVHQNSRELVRRGHEVTIYCTHLLDKTQPIQKGTFERTIDGIRVVYFDTWHLRHWPGTLGPIWLPDLPGYLAREIKSFNVVHLNGYRNLINLPIVRAARRAGVPVVMQPHGAMPVIVNSLLVKRLYDRLLGGQELRDLHALIAGQESERRQALSHGVPDEIITIVPNGLDLSDERDLPARGAFRARLGIDPERPLILFLGRINRKKGTDMLVEAFARMSGDEALLVIAGPDDGQLAEVESLIRKHRLEARVYLPGLVAREEVMSAFRDADIFVLPCRTDTFPMAIIESCQARTPMVVTDRCEIAHLVEDRVAEVVPFDDAAFSRAMERLLTDRPLHKRYRDECSRILQDTFSLASAVDQLEEIYQSTPGTVLAAGNHAATA